MEILQSVLLFMILGCAYKVDGDVYECNYTDSSNVWKIELCNTSCCSDTETNNQSVCCSTKEENGGHLAWVVAPIAVFCIVSFCFCRKMREKIEREKKEKEEKRNKTAPVINLQMPYKQEPWLLNESEITWANQFPSNSPTAPPRIPPPTAPPRVPPPSYMDVTRGAEGGAPANQKYETPIFVVSSVLHPPLAYEYIPPKT